MAKPRSTSMATDSVYIYVDNSNLWDEAKKLVGKSRGTGEGYDTRVRLDFSLVANLAADNRTIAKKCWYHCGSKPLQADTVWEKVKEQGFEVHERKKVTGLFDDITKMARETPEEKRSTFVIITGHEHAVPAIEEALKHKWKVEVHMWEHAISPPLKALEGRIKLRDLGKFENITFTNLQETTQAHTVNSQEDDTNEENGGTVNSQEDDANEENGGTVNSQEDDANEENGGTVNSQEDDANEENGGIVNSQTDNTVGSMNATGWTTVENGRRGTKRSRKPQVDNSARKKRKTL